MENTVLTEHQSACRAAHQQVQMLQHLYERLVRHGDDRDEFRFNIERRMSELQRDEAVLARKLDALDLLRSEPDPEREGLLEIVTGLKRAFGAGDDAAVGDRLIAEERELLRLSEQLAEHDSDDRLVDGLAHTRDAIANLESLSGGAD